MAPRKWADLTWEEVRDLDRPRAVALLPVGAVEAHGPHLPLATDLILAEAMAAAAAERLEAEGRIAVVLPALPYAAAPFGAGFPGTISVGAASVKALLLDLARELTRQGFAALGVANAHLDPAHLEMLAAARAAADEEELLPVICPDLTRKPWALRLGEEFQTGACHAGRYEGSVVLAVRPDLVREETRRALAPNPSSLSRAIRTGARTFEDAGGPRAYFGWPADATAEEGTRTIEALGAILAEAVLERDRG
ncbi:MAG TPA: creatininase family protein [Candidatus Omnitrophota bacterium]|nr:creatininase family protein [Candidatus Omnitrophota bacterium]